MYNFSVLFLVYYGTLLIGNKTKRVVSFLRLGSHCSNESHRSSLIYIHTYIHIYTNRRRVPTGCLFFHRL